MLAIHWICVIFMAWHSTSCWGCIPTPQHDDYLIPPDSFTCEDSAGAYIDNAVQLVDSSWGLAASQVCRMCPPSARQLHFDSSTNPIPNQGAKEAAGTIDLATCNDPCICGFFDTCYQRQQAASPDMTLYPYCDADGCFLALLLSSPGELFNVDDMPMLYTYDNQRDGAGNLKPVTDENAYLRVQSISCDACVRTPQCP